MIISLEIKVLKIEDGLKTYSLHGYDLGDIYRRADYIALETMGIVFRIYRKDVTSPPSTSIDDLYDTILSWYNVVKRGNSLDGICEVLESLEEIEATYPVGQLSQTVGSVETGTIFLWGNGVWTDTGMSYLLSNLLSQLKGLTTSGVYTPTLTQNVNILSSGVYYATYTRVGNIVHITVNGYMYPSKTGQSSLGISLPFLADESANGFSIMGSGVVENPTTGVDYASSVYYYIANRVTFHSNLTTGIVHTFNCQFDYVAQ